MDQIIAQVVAGDGEHRTQMVAEDCRSVAEASTALERVGFVNLFRDVIDRETTGTTTERVLVSVFRRREKREPSGDVTIINSDGRFPSHYLPNADWEATLAALVAAGFEE